MRRNLWESDGMEPMFDMPCDEVGGERDSDVWDGVSKSLYDGAEYCGRFDIARVEKQTFPENYAKNWVPFDKIRNKDISQSFIHFFLPDVKFKQLLNHPERYLKTFAAARGVVSPDFSLYRNAPLCIQMRNCLYSRLVTRYYQRRGVAVIVVARWGDERSLSFCFDGIEKGAEVAIGTQGCIRSTESKRIFVVGLREMFKRVEPTRVHVYGDMPDEVFGEFRKDNSDIFVHHVSDVRMAHM